MNKTSRTIAQGALLYAWNPLALQESCLGGHNDTFMVTFILLGLLFSVQAEKNTRRLFTAPSSFFPPLLLFTLSALIKFTSAPLIILFLILLVCKGVQATERTATRSFEGRLQQLKWSSLLQGMSIACLGSAGVILAFYTPFWAGHSIHTILDSFSSPPSAHSAYGSILGAVLNWEKAYGGQYKDAGSTLLLFFSQHKTWQNIGTGTAALTLLVSTVWLWRCPTTQTLALTTSTVLGAILIVTPWFFPWYVIWLIGLASVCLPTVHDRVARALLGFTFTFSATAHSIYFFRGYQPLGDWIGWTFLTTIGPPLIVLLVLLAVPKTHRTLEGN